MLNTPTAENVEEEENAAENAFYTASEFTEEVNEEKRNSTDHTILEPQAEDVYEFNNKGGEAAMESANPIPNAEMEVIKELLFRSMMQEGLLDIKGLATADISEKTRIIKERLIALREAEESQMIMQAQIEGMQDQAIEMLEQKENEHQQTVEQMQTKYQAMLEEKEREAETERARMTRRLRDSGQEYVAQTEELRQLREEFRELKQKASIEGKFDEGPSILGGTRGEKFRKSLGAETVDRTDAGKMVLVYGRVTKPMTRNAQRDKEQEGNVQSIAEALQTMGMPVSVGWLAPKKLEATERKEIDKEIQMFVKGNGSAKLTPEKAKDWNHVCRVFIDALGSLSPAWQRGALANMFRTIVDKDGDIKAGVKMYADLVSAHKETMSPSEYKKLLEGCNDDGEIVLKLIKGLLEPLSPDLVKAYAGEEAGVGLHDIGNAMAEAWTALSIAKACLEDSFVTDADESLTKVVNGTEELWKKHCGCLKPIMMELEHEINKHVNKYGPITQETVLRMLFMRVIFTHGKQDFTVKMFIKNLKDRREYIKEMQSWGEMHKVVDDFIDLAIENDETYGEAKKKKRAASMVAQQNKKKDGDGPAKGGGRDYFNTMFAQKPTKLEDDKCDGCGLDAHQGECVKKANAQRVRDERAPAMQSVNRRLDKAGINAEEREQILKDIGREMGRMAVMRGRGRGGANRGGRGATGGNLQVPTASAPTAAVVADAGKADAANGGKKVQMSAEDLKICKENNLCRFHASGSGCKFEGTCKYKHATKDERKKIGLSFNAASSKSEAQKGSEEELISELLDDVRDITAAGPVANRGGAFHAQFGVGMFAVSAEEFARLTTEEAQMIAEEVMANQVEEDVPIEPGEAFQKEELEIVKVLGNGSCLFNAIAEQVDVDPKQLRQMAADAVVPNAAVEYNGLNLHEWIFNEEHVTPETYAEGIRQGKWGGAPEMHLLAQSLKIPICVYRQPEEGVFTLQHQFEPISGRKDSAEPIRVLLRSQHYDALIKKSERERGIAGMERPAREAEGAAVSSAAEQHEEEVKSVLDMLISKIEQAEAGQDKDVGLAAAGSEDSEEGWTTVRPRSRGKKAQRERTGLAKEEAQKCEVVPMRTGITLLVEPGTEGYESSMDMEDADALCTPSTDIKHAYDSMGRIIVEDGMKRLMPIRPRVPGESTMPIEEINAREQRPRKGEREQAAASKGKAKAVMQKSRPARREAQRATSRQPAVSAEKQAMLKEQQDRYLKELIVKHELQQQEGRYIKAPRYLHATSKAYADRRYLEDAAEKAVEMMQAGTVGARSVQIKRQVSQDWQTRRKLSKKWQKIMKRRLKVRRMELKHERGKAGKMKGTATPAHMHWKTHVVGDAVVQTCRIEGKLYTKWDRRMPNVPFAAPASWTWQPETSEITGTFQLVRKQQEELAELRNRGITSEVTQAVLEQTWRVVQEQVGEGSAMQGLNTKVWRTRNTTQQCSSCGMSMTDRADGAFRCRGARNTTARHTGQCCNCRFAWFKIDSNEAKLESLMAAKHSCVACKTWRRLRARLSERMAGRGLTWEEYHRAIRTPQHTTQQVPRDAVSSFLAQHRHNAWARSSQEIQEAMLTKRRRRRLRRCRQSINLDDHRKDPSDDAGGAQLMGVQNNNEYCKYFSREKGLLKNQPIMKQKLAQADHRQVKPWEEKWQPVAAQKIKVAWRSRVTGAHPLSAFMKVEAYRMFEYDTKLKRYRCFYAHDPGVDLMQFMQCFNVRAVPGVRLHLLDSGSSLFLTPFKDALILAIKTVMNIRGVGGDVSKIKSPLVYTFLDSRGEYVGFHYQALHLLESLPIPLFATGPAEQQMWSFWLGPSSPCAITADGRFIPIIRCATTGFHWMPERIKALPTLEGRRRIAQRVRDMPNFGGLDLAWPPVVEGVDGAEEKPNGPVTQHQHEQIINNIASLTLGGEAAAKAHVVTRQQQRQNEAKADTVADISDKPASSSKATKVIKNDKKQTRSNIPKGFFKIEKIVDHRVEAGEREYRVRWKGYDESHDEWKKENDITKEAIDEYQEHLEQKALSSNDNDAQEINDECRKMEAQHQLDNEDEVDEQLFRRVRREREGTPMNSGIRLKIPRNRYIDTGLPADVKKAQKHVHEMLGHLGWKTIQRGLAQVQGCEGLVRLLEGAGDNRHCTACELTKSRLPPFPTGKTFRLKRVAPLDKCYIDLSGRINEESILHKFHYYCSSVTRKGFGVIRGLRYKSQALMGVNKIFNETGVPDETQIDGEGALACPEAQEWFDGVKTHCVKIEAGQHFRHGKIEVRHRIWKGMARAMLERAGMHIAWWFFAIRHAVLITNLVLLEAVEEGSAKATGKEERTTVWEAHFGVKPRLDQYVLGPFGCLAFLLLSEEQRRQRGLCGHFGDRSLQGIYLGCACDSATGVFQHLFTDGKTIFATAHGLHVVPDAYPLAVKIRSNATFGYIEDINEEIEGDDQVFDAKALVGVVAEALADKEREIQRYLEYRRDSDAQRVEAECYSAKAIEKGERTTRLAGDDRRTGKNMRRPHQLVAVDGVGGAKTKRLEEDKNADDGEKLQVPGLVDLLEDLPEEFSFSEPYSGAKYKLAEATDFSDENRVPIGGSRPFSRFIGRKVRRYFESTNPKQREDMTPIEGIVERYNPTAKLFRIRYPSQRVGDDVEDLDLMTLQDVLVMGKKYGDAKHDWGRTRDERNRAATFLAIYEEVLEERRYSKVHASDAHESKADGQGECYNTAQAEKVLYDDEPRNLRELLAHPERAEIQKAGDDEIQQLIDQRVGVIVPKAEVDEIVKSGGKVLNAKMLFKRKYEIVDGVERFKKWKGRLAVVGTGEIPGVDSSFSSFSPTVAFSAVRMLVALTVDPQFSVESYDLSGAFLGTELRDRAVYVRLPAEAGEYAGKVLLLLKSVYGLKTSGREFVQQLSEQILSFTLQVKCPKTGKDIEARFVRLAIDHCIYRYEDAMGRIMLVLHYVDDIIAATTDRDLRETFFDHVRKKWAITAEGQMNRFLGISYVWNREKGSCKASAAAYIERVARRFGLEEVRTHDTPMEAGFEISENDFLEEPTEEMVTLYRSLIGSIGYAAVTVRFDVSYALSVLSRHLSRPNARLIAAAKRVVKYLMHTKDMGITWSISEQDKESGFANVLFGAVDASFAMCKLTRKSHFGYTTFLNHGLVSWKSKLQSIVTLSSAESEYVALCELTCEVRYLRQLAKGLGFEQKEPTLCYEDNRATIMSAENECSAAGRMKHVDVKFRFVQESIKMGEIRVRYIPTELNWADVLTKALVPKKHKDAVELILGSKEAYRLVVTEKGTLVQYADSYFLLAYV